MDGEKKRLFGIRLARTSTLKELPNSHVHEELLCHINDPCENPSHILLALLAMRSKVG